MQPVMRVLSHNGSQPKKVLIHSFVNTIFSILEPKLLVNWWLLDYKKIYFNNQLINEVEETNILLTFVDLQHIFVVYHSNLRITGLWTVGQTKHPI